MAKERAGKSGGVINMDDDKAREQALQLCFKIAQLKTVNIKEAIKWHEEAKRIVEGRE